MTISVFEDKSIRPGASELAAALGPSKSIWDSILGKLEKEHGPIAGEWKFYGKASGWGQMIKSKTRTVLYLYPCKDSFKVLFVFGEKAIEAAQKSSLPVTVMNAILGAKRYTEGRSFWVEVKESWDEEIIYRLIAIKMAF